MGAEAQAAGAGGAWFIQAGGKVWGPYPLARIETFVAEGRVAAETLIAPDPEGPFQAAARQARLQRLFGEVEPATTEASVTMHRAAAPTAAPAAAETGAVRPLLVWATLRSQRPERFEELLGSHGAFVRIGAGLWLVRARVGPAALRNAMTRRLEAGDTLMVLEAPLERAAWFNIDAEIDRTLRQLWATKLEG